MWLEGEPEVGEVGVDGEEGEEAGLCRIAFRLGVVAGELVLMGALIFGEERKREKMDV